jgi:glycosyltransferase involved in cell wall biosynthesis
MLGVEKARTTVIHLATSFSMQDSHGPSDVDNPYFLYVGSREWPKNFRQFVKAFVSCNTTNQDVVLVCFGGGKFTPDEVDFFRSLHLSEKQVRFFSGDDNLLQRLYSNAIALVYPSLYEGFGLPLLEAMACGCPVICSNTSSMPEVAGEAAIYFTPTVVDEITGAMHQIIEAPATRADLISRGFDRVRQFSWEKCARETAQVYRLCLQDNR